MKAIRRTADRAKQTARRKAIYLELHPETAAGVAGAEGRWNANANFAPAFSTETAKVTGQSERLVQLNAERGEKVIDAALDIIRGTVLDTGATSSVRELPKTSDPRPEPSRHTV